MMRVRNMAKSKRVRTPNCTHVDMDRVYGRDQTCHLCGREPSIGFLYECKQDRETQSLHDLLEQTNDNSMEVAKTEMRLQLEWAGLCESVIRAAEQGHYTIAQLELLKAQKQELRQVISDTLQAAQINSAMSQLAAMEQTPSNHDGAGASKVKDAGPPACTFKACHTCRPYYRDRVYISFQSVIEADFPPLKPHDAEALPMKSAQIMKFIGGTTHSYLSPTTTDATPLSVPTSNSLSASTDAPPTASTSTSTSSDLTFRTTQTDLDEISAQRRPRRRFYKMGHRTSRDIAHDLDRQSKRLSGLKTAVQSIFRPGRESSSEGSSITLPLARTGALRNTNGSQQFGDFDLPALRRVRKQKEMMDVNSGMIVAGFEDVPATPAPSCPPTRTPLPTMSTSVDQQADSPGTSVSVFADLSICTSASTGSEVEVDGGVALTEEAVEMHTPDILAVDASTDKKMAMETSVEEEEDDDDDDNDTDAEADVGLHSIMAQV